MATVKQTKTFNGNTGNSEWAWKQVVTESFNDDYIATNKSIINVKTYLTRAYSNSQFGGNADCNIKCKNSSGAVIFNKDVNKTFNWPTNVYVNSWLLIQEETFEVEHKADGTQSITIESMLNTSDFSPYWTYASGEMPLTTIPRTSKVTCPSFNIGNSTVINIERASNSFIHTLTYQFGTATGPIVAKTTSTSVGWTPTADIFYSQTINVTSRKGKVICQTYSGDTLIGTSEAEFTAYVTQANPDVTATIVDTNSVTIALTGDSSKLVRYYSKPKVTINATAKNKATIASYKTTIADNQQSTTQVTTFPKIDTNGITVLATDSRGWTGSKLYTPSFVNYVKLAFTSVAIDRTESTSTTVYFKIKGNYFNASFGSAANTLSLKWRWRKVGETWSAYIDVSSAITKTNNTFSFDAQSSLVFDNNTDYQFEFLATDKLMPDISTGAILVTKGEGVIDIYDKEVHVNGLVKSNDVALNIYDVTDKFKINSENAEFSNTYASKIFRCGNIVHINLFLTLQNGYTNSFENLNLGKLDESIAPKIAIIDSCLTGTATYAGWTFDALNGQVNINTQGEIIVRNVAQTTAQKKYIGIDVMYLV